MSYQHTPVVIEGIYLGSLTTPPEGFRDDAERRMFLRELMEEAVPRYRKYNTKNWLVQPCICFLAKEFVKMVNGDVRNEELENQVIQSYLRHTMMEPLLKEERHEYGLPGQPPPPIPTFEILTNPATGNPIGITHTKCGKTSWNKNDIEKKYCGHCHIFLEDEMSPL